MTAGRMVVSRQNHGNVAAIGAAALTKRTSGLSDGQALIDALRQILG